MSAGAVDAGRDPTTNSLFGRESDLRMLCGFVDAARESGGALLLTGEAGVGKSAVLGTVAAYASDLGVRVLRATGAQFEVSISFAGLRQLLFPLLGQLDQLDDGSGTLLRNAFGTGGHVSADRLAVSHAALALLVAASESVPVLLVVDDLPWLDPVSTTCPGPTGAWLRAGRWVFPADSDADDRRRFVRTYSSGRASTSKSSTVGGPSADESLGGGL